MFCFIRFLFQPCVYYKASLVAQTVKRLPAVRETWVRSLGWEDLLEKEMATHSSTLAWKIPWTEKPGRLQSMGSQRVGHNWATSLGAGTHKICVLHPDCLNRLYNCLDLGLDSLINANTAVYGGRAWRKERKMFFKRKKPRSFFLTLDLSY